MFSLRRAPEGGAIKAATGVDRCAHRCWAEPVLIRPATSDDLEAINDLYNALIPTTVIAWTEQTYPMEDRVTWFAARRAAGDPVLVAETHGGVIGYASYAEFRDNQKWPGYRFTAELTIHVAESSHGRGVGRALMTRLIEAARDAGLHVLVAGVDGENDQSILFHKAMGFVEVARMPETGRKFGRWLDLVMLQRFVDDPP